MSSQGSTAFAPAAEARSRVASLRARLTEGARLSVAVVGGGKSGLAATELLLAKGAKVEVLDDDPKRAARKLPAGVHCSELTEDAVSAVDLVVLSPGVPRAKAVLSPAIAAGRLVGEIELASWFVKAPLVGITGTNGKSTTTALIAHILRTAGQRCFAGGNLGEPLSRLAMAELKTSESTVDYAVVELSSYQLESIVEATFAVSVWLNLSADHTDRYPDLDTYAAAKRRIIERRSTSGVAVLNAKDRFCSSIGIRIGGPIRWFAAATSSDLAGPMGTLLNGENDAIRSVRTGRNNSSIGRAVAGEGPEEVFSLRNEALLGLHNRANACAAIEACRHLGVLPEHVQAGLLSFGGLPHRLERVGEIGGAIYYNDSKATNIEATLTAIAAVSGPKILILGGQDKGAPWAPLVQAAESSNVECVLAIGAAESLVQKAFAGSPITVESAKTLERAVRMARDLAQPGWRVLLAPACASFDQFVNFEARGDAFRAFVHELDQDASPESS